MSVQRGDVVLVYYPFTTSAGGKIRPALVVQSDHNNVRLHDTIIAAITSTTHRALAEPTRLLIDVTTSEGKQTGLIRTSALTCEHLRTISFNEIRRVIGTCPASLMMKVDYCLKASLGIP